METIRYTRRFVPPLVLLVCAVMLSSEAAAETSNTVYHLKSFISVYAEPNGKTQKVAADSDVLTGTIEVKGEGRESGRSIVLGLRVRNNSNLTTTILEPIRSLEYLLKNDKNESIQLNRTRLEFLGEAIAVPGYRFRKREIAKGAVTVPFRDPKVTITLNPGEEYFAEIKIDQISGTINRPTKRLEKLKPILLPPGNYKLSVLVILTGPTLAVKDIPVRVP